MHAICIEGPSRDKKKKNYDENDPKKFHKRCHHSKRYKKKHEVKKAHRKATRFAKNFSKRELKNIVISVESMDILLQVVSGKNLSFRAR